MSMIADTHRRRGNSSHPGYTLGRPWGPERSRLPPGQRRPFVFINAAISADGKLAPATRQFEPFGGQADGRLLYELRAYADAIIAGARTLDLNPFDLDNGGELYGRWRRRQGLAEQPLRVIVSGRASFRPDAAILRHRVSPLILLTTQRAPRARLRALRAKMDDVLVCGDTEIDWASALSQLRRRWRIRRLLSEGGGELNGALFAARVVDLLYVTWCPVIFGGTTAPTLADGPGFPALAQAASLELEARKCVDSRVFLRFRVHADAATPRR